MAGDLLLEESNDVNISVKTKIRFNGQEYSSPDQLPPEVQAAYRKACMERPVSLHQCLGKIVVNGTPITGDPEAGRRLYEDIMSVVENNGHVTLPVSSEPLLNSRRVKMAVAVLAAATAVAVAVLSRSAS
jgi:hypothetical protein